MTATQMNDPIARLRADCEAEDASWSSRPAPEPWGSRSDRKERIDEMRRTTDPDGIRSRAEQRFELLRRQARESVVAPAPAPVGWCISTIARIVTQDEPLTTVIQGIQARLSAVGRLHVYPRESLHLSLLGCTQREPDRQPARGKRMADIVRALDRAVLDVDPVPVTLGGLNLVGPQFFIEVLTEETAWRSLRERLAAELTRIGENPMTHADPEPMHLNIARILRLTDPAELRRLLAEDRPTVNAALELATIELVVTDFVVTPATLTVTHTARLGRPGPERLLGDVRAP
jgi:hypothetical protein